MLQNYFKKGFILLIISLFLAFLTSITCYAEDYEARKTNINLEIENYTTVLTEKETELEALKTKLKTYEEELNRKQYIVSNLETEVNEKEGLLKSNISELTENILSKEKIHLNNNLPYINLLIDKNKQLNSRLDSAMTSKVETKNIYNDLMQDITNLETEKTDLENNINLKKNELAEIEKEEALINTYNYSEAELDLMCAIVAQECNSSYDGALAVISCAINRANSPSWGYLGGDPLSQLKAPGQFCYSIDTNWQSRLNGNYPDYVKQAVLDGIKGQRNHNYLSFRGYQTTNSINIGGNWYF